MNIYTVNLATNLVQNWPKNCDISKFTNYNRAKFSTLSNNSLCTNCATVYAFVRCIDCEESLCHSCNTAHSIIKKFQHHKIESLSTNLVDWAENEVNLNILNKVWATTQGKLYPEKKRPQ